RGRRKYFSASETTNLSNTGFTRSRGERGDFQQRCWISFSGATRRTTFYFSEIYFAPRPDSQRKPARRPARRRRSTSWRNAPCIEDVAQIGDIGFEGAAAFARQRHARPRPLVGEILGHADIAGVFQRGDVGAEIAFGGADDALELHEFELRVLGQRLERRHDLQAH